MHPEVYMARVLLHYDIDDDETRAAFQKAITDPKLDPRFKQVTHSVYEANMTCTEANLNAVRARLLAALPNDAPKGTKVVFEHPTMFGNAPGIESSVLADA
jgi:CRISPR/Cas system-associated endoribonuclease Cas2